jgi:hypothetical protein
MKTKPSPATRVSARPAAGQFDFRRTPPGRLGLGALAGLALLAPAAAASAADIAPQFGLGPEWTLRVDNTVKLSTSVRTKSPDSQLLTLNGDDGDRDFRSGFITKRVDLLTQFDIAYQGFGFSGSSAAWYDAAYDGTNDNNSRATANVFSVPFNRFSHDARDLHGHRIEVLNAFLYGKFNLGETPLNIRVGRQTSIWGESLFFGTNGVANAQAPIDVVKAQGVPNTPFKELLIPVGQVTATAQLSSNLSLSGFYQFEWRKTRIAAAGSYFSTFDGVGDGAERILFNPGVGAAARGLFRGHDMNGKSGDNFGAAVHYQPTQNWDLGAYAANYTDTQPQVYSHLGVNPRTFQVLDPGIVNFGIGKLGEFFLVYPRNIQVYALSASTSFDHPQVNLAAEVGLRRNAPLQSTSTALTFFTGIPADGDRNPLYAVGDTLHVNVSAIQVLPATPLWGAATWTSEVAMSHVLNVTKNEAAFNPARDKTSLGLRTVFSASYFQVLPGLDVSVPIGLGVNFLGRSPTTSTFNNTGADRGGDVSIGVSGTYKAVWQGGLSYTHFVGPATRNAFADRDFLSANVQYSF